MAHGRLDSLEWLLIRGRPLVFVVRGLTPTNGLPRLLPPPPTLPLMSAATGFGGAIPRAARVWDAATVVPFIVVVGGVDGEMHLGMHGVHLRWQTPLHDSILSTTA